MTFCPIPWKFQAIRNNGDIRLCCQANITKNQGICAKKDGTNYNAKSDNLLEAFNSQLLKDVRLNMLTGKWSEECGRCKIEEESNIKSRRQNELEIWNFDINDAKKNTNADGTTELQPVYYDLRFGNFCNLKCRMCGPTDSHQWYKEWEEFHNEDGFYDTTGKVLLQKDSKGRLFTDIFNWHEKEIFWNQIRQSMSSLQHVYMAGGEPLLIERHYEFLETAVNNGHAKDIILEYNTNITTLPNRVLDLWKHFKKVKLGLSIDGIGDVFEYQRYPASWKNVLANLEKINLLVKNNKNISAWFATTITSYNLYHIPEFLIWKTKSNLDYIKMSKKKPIITYHVQHQPYRTSIQSLPKNEKDKVKIYYDNFINSLDDIELDDLLKTDIKNICNNILNFMYKQDRSSHWQEFIRFTNFLDKSRNQSIESVVPYYEL
jgi:hypothetical protein